MPPLHRTCSRQCTLSPFFLSKPAFQKIWKLAKLRSLLNQFLKYCQISDLWEISFWLNFTHSNSAWSNTKYSVEQYKSSACSFGLCWVFSVHTKHLSMLQSIVSWACKWKPTLMHSWMTERTQTDIRDKGCSPSIASLQSSKSSWQEFVADIMRISRHN